VDFSIPGLGGAELATADSHTEQDLTGTEAAA
jgi:hypothetical protein